MYAEAELIEDDRVHSAVMEYLMTHGSKKHAAGIMSLFANYAAGGTENLTSKQFHPASSSDPNIYRFGKGHIRVYCFFDGPNIIIASHGTMKKSQKTDPKDLDKANDVRDRYFEDKDAQAIEVHRR